MKELSLLVKRICDVILSTICLVIISPVLLCVAVAIKIFIPGSIFFMQQRVGKNGKIFKIIKFRSMKVDVDAEKNHDFTKDAERMTEFGKLIRRLKIDELPQLINVLKGDMSLVGPRPTVREQTDNYNDYQRQRLNMRPGITGLAQVNGNTALTWDERIDYDIDYINHFSLGLDLFIMAKTIVVVLRGENKFKKVRENE